MQESQIAVKNQTSMYTCEVMDVHASISSHM